MTAEIEIKKEFAHDDICPVCLSVGRKLFLLGPYQNVYNSLVADMIQIEQNISDVKLCWECVATLRKARHFQMMAVKANELLLLGQAYMHGPLSNFQSTILENSYLGDIYIDIPDTKNESNIKLDLDLSDDIVKDNNDGDISVEQTDEKNNDDFNNDVKVMKTDPDDDSIDDNDEMTKNDELPFNLKEDGEKLVRKRHKSHRWAKKRASLYKKTLTIITDHKTAECFKKIKIAIEDAREKLSRERISNNFRFNRMKYKCYSCVTGFKKEDEYIEHNNKCHGEENGDLICDICSTRLKDKVKLCAHLREHCYKYECIYCDYSCFDKTRRQRHVRTHHQRIFKCAICGLFFGRRRLFYKHHKEKHQKFICDHCGMTFRMRYCIKDHMKKMHSTFECKPCGKSYVQRKALLQHNQRHHGAPAQAAYCVECDRHFVDVQRYRVHLYDSVRHRPRKKKQIPCPSCDKTFSKNIYMKQHYDFIHLKQFKFRCDECDKNFLRNSGLRAHVSRAHRGEAPPRNKICHLCGRGFSSNKILRNHIRTHTGERPHACPQCDARFAQHTALKTHVRSVHRAKIELGTSRDGSWD